MIAKIEKIIKWFFWVPFVLAFIGYFWADGGAGCKFIGSGSTVCICGTLFCKSSGRQCQYMDSYRRSAGNYCDNQCYHQRGECIVRKSCTLVGKKMEKILLPFIPDTSWGEQLAATLKHGYLKSDSDLEDAEKTHDHIIMFSDDQKNLNFYEHNKEKMKDGRVFLALNQIDSFLLNSSSDKNVHFFQVYDLIARKYWKENHLYEEIFHHKDGIGTGEKQTYKIAIIGYGNMGRSIFKYGFK